MRTNSTFAVANRTVFGFGQDRVVSLRNDSCAHAAQHLESRHAGKQLGSTRALKRRWLSVALAGTALKAKWTCLVITGPMRPVVRPMSPAVVVG